MQLQQSAGACHKDVVDFGPHWAYLLSETPDDIRKAGVHELWLAPSHVRQRKRKDIHVLNNISDENQGFELHPKITYLICR